MTRDELQAIMDCPGFGTGRAFLDRKAQESECLSLLLPPEDVAPVMASRDAGVNWLICSFGCDDDGDDWHLTTDRVRGSSLLNVSFPDDAKADAHFVAALVNAYRFGLLVVKANA